MSFSPEQVLSALAHVVEPTSGHDIVRLDLIKGLRIDGCRVQFTILLSEPGTPFANQVAEACRRALHDALGADVQPIIEVDAEMIGLGDDLQIGGTGQKRPQQAGPQATNILAVASGKGGVGKSTVASNLAVALAQQGYAVGLVDTDIYGPSVPTMFGLEGERPRINDQRKIIPLERHGVKLLSIGFMVDPNRAVIWRGPMVSNAVRQFLNDTAWGRLDYLVLDLPPGTGDIQLTIVQTLALTGAVIVSTPQNVALADARKGVAMFNNVNVPVLGIVENMAYFTPPDLPDRKYYLFGEGGARRLAGELAVPFLGEVPIEQAVREGGDFGEPIVVSEPESLSAQAFAHVATEAVRQVTLRNAEQPPTQKIEILYR
ncbi:MAG: Mrp/NBP35 family ATP-binding protein [Bacteroidota bacterium]